MFCILTDAKTHGFYMRPREISFYAYSSPEKFNSKGFDADARLVETECGSFKELTTELFNAGFIYGFLDDKPVRLSKSDAYYYNKNINEIAYIQYLLTKDESYLQIMKKDKLLTVCRIEGGDIFFPTVTLPNGEDAILAYTDRMRIPTKIFEKYKNWKVVYMSYKAQCVVNNTSSVGAFIIE